MSRNPELESLLQAKYDLDTAEEAARQARQREYIEKLDDIVASSRSRTLTRHQIEEAMLDAYREFRHAKRLEERARLGRLR